MTWGHCWAGLSEGVGAGKDSCHSRWPYSVPATRRCFPVTGAERSLCPSADPSLLQPLRRDWSLGQSKGFNDNLLSGRQFGSNSVGYFPDSVKLLNRGRGLSLREMLEQPFGLWGLGQGQSEGEQHFRNSAQHSLCLLAC